MHPYFTTLAALVALARTSCSTLTPDSLHQCIPVMTDFKFNHVGLSVANISLQTRFYKDVMGFNQVVNNYTLREPNTIHVVKLQNRQGAMIELIDNVESVRVENVTNPVEGSMYQGYFHWALQVPNLDNIFTYLTGNGTGAHAVVNPSPDVSGGGGRYAYVADPEGNLIELIQIKPLTGMNRNIHLE